MCRFSTFKREGGKTQVLWSESRVCARCVCVRAQLQYRGARTADTTEDALARALESTDVRRKAECQQSTPPA